MADREGNILLHIVWKAIDGLVLQLSRDLHNEVGVIASEIMKNDRNSSRELKIQIASVMGRPSEFTGEVAVISEPINTKLLSTNMTMSGFLKFLLFARGQLHRNYPFHESMDSFLFLL